MATLAKKLSWLSPVWPLGHEWVRAARWPKAVRWIGRGVLARSMHRSILATLAHCGDDEVDSLVLGLLETASRPGLCTSSVAAMIEAWRRLSADAQATVLAHDYLPWRTVALSMLTSEGPQDVARAAEFIATGGQIELVPALLARSLAAEPSTARNKNLASAPTAASEELRTLIETLPMAAAHAFVAAADGRQLSLTALQQAVSTTLAPPKALAHYPTAQCLTALAGACEIRTLGKLLAGWTAAARVSEAVAPQGGELDSRYSDADEAAAVARCDTSYMAARSVIRRGKSPLAVKLAISVAAVPSLTRAASDRLTQGSLGPVEAPNAGKAPAMPKTDEGPAIREFAHLLLRPDRKAAMSRALVDHAARHSNPNRATPLPSLISALCQPSDVIVTENEQDVVPALLGLRHWPMRSASRQAALSMAAGSTDASMRWAAAAVASTDVAPAAVLHDLAFDGDEATASLAATAVLTYARHEDEASEKAAVQLATGLMKSPHERVRGIAQCVLAARAGMSQLLVGTGRSEGVKTGRLSLRSLLELPEQMVIARLVEMRAAPVSGRHLEELCDFVRCGHKHISQFGPEETPGGQAIESGMGDAQALVPGPYTPRVVAAALPTLARAMSPLATELLHEVVESPWPRVRSTAIESLFASERHSRMASSSVEHGPIAQELSATLLAGAFDPHHRVATSSLRALLSVTHRDSPATDQLIDRAATLLTCETDIHTLATLWLIERKLDVFAAHSGLVDAIDELAGQELSAEVGDEVAWTIADRCVMRAGRVSRAFNALRSYPAAWVAQGQALAV